MTTLPRFFRVGQSFARPQINDLAGEVHRQLTSIGLQQRISPDQTVAITVGSRGIANIAAIAKHCVDFFKQIGAKPFIIPAMGSHGGATADGQALVLASYGVTEPLMGCPVRSSMEVIEVCQATEGFPVYFDREASLADHVFVLNRIKPHTRFTGDIESGLMKMMLIGLGKQKGAEVYHRVIMNYSFDQIVRSVSRTVIERCGIVGGLAILENAYEETAQLTAIRPEEIEAREPALLRQVKEWMPGLPFDRAELLIVDRIGKDISGTGMDTNVIGRKLNDHGAPSELPFIHHIYVRGLTEATHGNATGLGVAEMCHRRVIDEMDMQLVRMNCITAGHITAAMIPLDFPSDLEALRIGCQLAGYIEPDRVPILWITDTLHLEEVECSEAYWQAARERADLKILREPTPLAFDANGDLK
ncbi:MAG: [Fe-S]-binding protein [Pirellulaceae bacterium]|nr:[Fe-S]-binding protein [Pirellulaceae bacterium]